MSQTWTTLPPPLATTHRFHRIAGHRETDLWLRTHARRIRCELRENGCRALAQRTPWGAAAMSAIDSFCYGFELVGYVGPLETIAIVLEEHHFGIEIVFQVPDRGNPSGAVALTKTSTHSVYDVLCDGAEPPGHEMIAMRVRQALRDAHDHELHEVFRIGGKLVIDEHAGEVAP